MIRRLLFGLGAVAWGAASFLVGLYVTFPSDVARDRVVYEFGERTKNEYALELGDLALWRLSGATADDVTFYSVKKARRAPKDEEKPPAERTPVLRLDTLSIRAAPVAMLVGKQAAAFVAEIYGGAIDGQYSQSESLVEVSFDASDVDLGKLPVETEQLTLNLLGVLAGEADLTFNQTEVKESKGTLKLSFEGLGLGAGSAVAGFTLPEVVFSKAAVAFEVKEGKFEVTEGVFESDTLNAELSGDIVLNKRLARSRNRLELVFSLPEDLDKLAQIAPDLKRSRDEDGKYHMSIGGTVLSPTARFTRASIKRADKDDDEGPRPRLAGDENSPRLGGDAALSDDERREAREKRIQERRERLRKRREEAEARGGGAAAEDEGPKFNGGEDFEGGEDGPLRDGPLRDGPRFPPEGPDGGPMEGPMDGPPMDDVPPDFEQMDQ